MNRDDLRDQRERAGQCADCQFARVMGSAKGSEFWLCARANDDERYPRYPPLPVSDCSGFEAR